MAAGNPALNTNTFADFRDHVDEHAQDERGVMTIQGTVNRIGFLLILAAAGAAFSFATFFRADPGFGGQAVMPLMIGGLIGGLVLAMVTIFFPKASPVTAPLYAVFEGLFLGGISAFFEVRYPGVPMQAIVLTFGVLIGMLALYTFRIIKPTERLIQGVIAATFGISLAYFFNFLLSMFGFQLPFLHSNGLIGIGISLVIVGVAAFNLIIDFHVIEEGAKAKAPTYMSWYAAFGILVTLVWLYLEMLRLLSKLSSRD